ncbi:hypothetical protein GCM10023264_07390 [Sphingomonas daechungensis]
MKTYAVTGTLLALLLAAGCQRKDDDQGNRVQLPTAARGAGQNADVTPMAERVAVISLLNKRNGIVRDLTMKPGQSIQVKDAIVRLRACETTAPWESEKLTGAFLQLDVQQPDKRWIRAFSGWVYKESPSLNVVEHPIYDVWPKSCAMTYPSAAAEPAAPVASSNRSRANRSGSADRRDNAAGPAEAPAPEPSAPTEPAPAPPSAAESNAT